MSSGATKAVRVSCPGQKLPIRGKPNKSDEAVGFLRSGDIIEIYVDIVSGFYQLADGRGYVNKNTKNVDWVEIESPQEVVETKSVTSKSLPPPNTSVPLVTAASELSLILPEHKSFQSDIERLRIEKAQLEDEIARLRIIANGLKYDIAVMKSEIGDKQEQAGERKPPTRRRTALPILQLQLTAGLRNLRKANENGTHDVKHNWDEYESKDIDRLTFSKNGIEKEPTTQELTTEGPNLRKSVETELKSGAMASAVELFNRNLRAFKSRLIEGIRSNMWEGEFVVKVGVLVKLDSRSENILFEKPTRLNEASNPLLHGLEFKFVWAVLKIRNTPSKIYETMPGAEVAGAKDNQSFFLTVVSKSSIHTQSRVIGLELSCLEDRNNLLTGFRTLVTEQHMVSMNSLLPVRVTDSQARLSAFSKPAIASSALTNRRGSVSQQDATQRRSTITNPNLDEALRKKLSISSDDSGETNMSTHSVENGSDTRTASESYDSFDMRASLTSSTSNNVRGSSKTIMKSLPKKSPQPSSSIPTSSNSSTHGTDADDLKDSTDIKNQLLMERVHREKMMVQILMLTNDLHERDDQIVDLKEREEVLYENLTHLERLYEQEIVTSTEMATRLQEALVEKEEATDINEMLKEQLAGLKESLR